MCNVKFRGVLALGLCSSHLDHLSSTRHLCAISCICVHSATPEVPSVQSISSACAINEVICAVCEVPVLWQMFQSSDVAFRCVLVYQHLSFLFVLMYTCVYIYVLTSVEHLIHV